MPRDDENRAEVVSVGDLDRILRRAVEQATGHMWVQGEIASLRRVGSGHVYFVLKDEREEAIVDCVMYRFQAQRAMRHLENGSRVQLFGRATVWAPRGKLQFVAESARPAGRGDLLAKLEALKEKLSAEGLFDAARKRALPEEPRVIGVVTSRHGAAFHDIVKVAHGRARVRIILSAAQVQGEGSSTSIIAALDRLERIEGLDVIVVGRGGGSAEDLMSFNDEGVVRRIAQSGVPVVSAVGHEIDTTLSDLVADVRAATPSHAAEIVVPDDRARLERVHAARAQLARAIRSRLLEDRSVVLKLRQKTTDPRFVIADKQQLLDELMLRMERRTQRLVAVRRSDVASLGARLGGQHPRTVVARARTNLAPLAVRLHAAARGRAGRARVRLSELSQKLDALSPLRVLGRGYAIARARDGRVLRSAGDVTVGDTVEVRLGHGGIEARVSKVRGDTEGR